MSTYSLVKCHLSLVKLITMFLHSCIVPQNGTTNLQKKLLPPAYVRTTGGHVFTGVCLFGGGGGVPGLRFSVVGGGSQVSDFLGGGVPSLRFWGGGSQVSDFQGGYPVSDFWGGGPRSQISGGGGVPGLSKGKIF